MKRSSYIFTSLAALALAFLAAATAVLYAYIFSLRLTGEALHGERASAKGISVTEDMGIEGHLLWDLDWDSGSGSGEYRSRWTFPITGVDHVVSQPDISVSSGEIYRSFRTSVGMRRQNGGITGTPALDAILDDLRAGREDETELSGDFLLNDYTGFFPVRLDIFNIVDAVSGPDGVYPEELSVPLTDDVPLRVSYVNDGVTEEAVFEPIGEPVDLSVVYEYSCCTAPDGWFYFLVYAYDGETGELLEPAGGEGWGVWRIPITELHAYDRRLLSYFATSWAASDRDVTETPRWWTEDSYSISTDLARMERVYTPGGNWTAANLSLSYDGGSLLLITEEDGVFRLTVLDTGTGESVQTFSLFPAVRGGSERSETVRIFSDADTAVFVRESDGLTTLLPARIDGGRYVPGESIEFSDARPGLDCRSEGTLACASDGERITTLESVTLDEDGGRRSALLLRVFSEGVSTFTELFRDKQLSYDQRIVRNMTMTLNGESMDELREWFLWQYT